METTMLLAILFGIIGAGLVTVGIDRHNKGYVLRGLICLTGAIALLLFRSWIATADVIAAVALLALPVALMRFARKAKSGKFFFLVSFMISWAVWTFAVHRTMLHAGSVEASTMPTVLVLGIACSLLTNLFAVMLFRSPRL